MYRSILICVFIMISCGRAKYVDKTQPEETEAQVLDRAQPPTSISKTARNTTERLPVISKVDSLRLALGYQFVKTAIDKECAVCHTDSKIIDFRSFPFEYKGSYTESLVRREISSSQQDEFSRVYYESKVILDEMIEALGSGYMPPTGKPSSYPLILEALKTWSALAFKRPEPYQEQD